MIAPKGVRKFALTAHVLASVGWIGAVVASLGLAVAALVGTDTDTVRAAYVSLDLLGRFVLVPFAFAALLGGLAQAFITKWGLLRHYWVIVKLIITVFATVILVTYTQTLAHFAQIASNPTASAEALRALRTPSVVIHASGALVMLVVATVLAMYKPKGMTAYGRRKEGSEERR